MPIPKGIPDSVRNRGTNRHPTNNNRHNGGYGVNIGIGGTGSGRNNPRNYKGGNYPVNAMPRGKGYTFETRRRERQIIQERHDCLESEISRWASEGLSVDNLTRDANRLREELKDYW